MHSSAQQVATRYLKKAIKSAASPNRLDPRTKQLINRRFDQVGLDENKGFEKAEHGYSKAWEVLAEFGIAVDDVINSHTFVDRSTPDGKANDGRANLHLAFTTRDDDYSSLETGHNGIINSMLVFSFHRKETGKFGCLCYVS